MSFLHIVILIFLDDPGRHFIVKEIEILPTIPKAGKRPNQDWKSRALGGGASW